MRTFIAFLPLALLSNAALASDAALQACVEIYKNSTVNYSQSQQTNIELARSFASFCKRDGSTNTSSSGVGLDAVIYSIPFKFSAESKSSSQKLEEFCKVGQSQFDTWNSGSVATSTVVNEALGNFNNCVRLADSGLQLLYSVTQPDILVVTGSANPGYFGYITSVAYDEKAMSCTSTDFDADHKSQTLHDAVHLKISDPFAITCTKKSLPALGGSAQYYPRTALAITASAVSPLSIVFPSDTLNGYELASQSSLAVSQASSDAIVSRNEARTQKDSAELLQHRLSGVTATVVTHAFGNGTRWGCPYGADWGRGLREEAQKACGANNYVTSSEIYGGGGTCGFGTTGYACVIIPDK